MLSVKFDPFATKPTPVDAVPYVVVNEDVRVAPDITGELASVH